MKKILLQFIPLFLLFNCLKCNFCNDILYVKNCLRQKKNQKQKNNEVGFMNIFTSNKNEIDDCQIQINKIKNLSSTDKEPLTYIVEQISNNWDCISISVTENVFQFDLSNQEFLQYFVSQINDEQYREFALYCLQIYFQTDNNFNQNISILKSDSQSFIQWYLYTALKQEEKDLNYLQKNPEQVKDFIQNQSVFVVLTILCYLRSIYLQNNVFNSLIFDYVGYFYMDDIFKQKLQQYNIGETRFVKKFKYIMKDIDQTKAIKMEQYFENQVEIQEKCALCQANKIFKKMKVQLIIYKLHAL